MTGIWKTHFRASPLTPCSVCPGSDLNTATGDTVLPLPLSISQGFESRTKYCPSFELAVCGEQFDFVLVYRTRRRHHHSVIDTIDYFHHSIILKYAVLCLSSLPLPHSLHLLDNIFNHYDDPNSDIGIVYFGMWVPHPFYPLFAHLFTEQNSFIFPTSNSPLSPAILPMSPRWQETYSNEPGMPWNLVAGVSHTASVKPKARNPTLAIRVRTWGRRPIFCRHACCCSRLWKPKVRGLNDRQRRRSPPRWRMRKSEARSLWCSSRLSTSHWVQGPSNNFIFWMAKDADW